MQKKLFRTFSFTLMIAVLVVILKIANWLPMAVQSDSMKRYGSIDEVRMKLNIRDIYVPSYFPQNFTWPPSEILAQNRPFTAIIMEFKTRERDDIILIISQAASAHFSPGGKITIAQIRETIPYNLKGRNALLEMGTCNNSEPCSRISWDEGRYKMNIIAKYTPIELVRIAESTVH